MIVSKVNFSSHSPKQSKASKSGLGGIVEGGKVSSFEVVDEGRKASKYFKKKFIASNKQVTICNIYIYI